MRLLVHPDGVVRPMQEDNQLGLNVDVDAGGLDSLCVCLRENGALATQHCKLAANPSPSGVAAHMPLQM